MNAFYWSKLTLRQKFDCGIFIIISALASVIVYQQKQLQNADAKCDKRVEKLEDEKKELKAENIRKDGIILFDKDSYNRKLEKMLDKYIKLENESDSLKNERKHEKK